VKSGIRVRLKGDPGRVGVVTDKKREREGLVYWQVQFPDLAQYVPEDQLEQLPDGAEDPLDLLAEGKLGRAIDLRRTLTHVRLGGRLANLLYSMETTNTDFLAYQFKPIIKFLNSPTKGILIADEVGLGKTIEAGLLWTELRSRYDYRRLLVLCPAFLRLKWKRELAKRFGVEATITDAKGTLEALQRASTDGMNYGYAIIASMQGLRPMKGWDQESTKEKRVQNQFARFLQKQEYSEPLVDLLIVDEAHYLRNPDPKKRKKTSILGELLRNVSDNIVLLSATPIHLRSQDLYQLLNIVDEATFNQPRVFDEILKANAPLVKARDAVMNNKITSAELVDLLREAQNHSFLKESKQLKALIENPPSDSDLMKVPRRLELTYQLETINLSGHVLTRTRRRDVEEHHVQRVATPEAIPMSPDEQEFYNQVTQAIRKLCKKHSKHEGFLLMTPQRQMSSSMPAALRDWQNRGGEIVDNANEDIGEIVEEEEVTHGFIVDELIRIASHITSLEDLWKNDSKYNRFRALVVDEYLRKNPKAKVVVFSYFRATLDYLHERLTNEGIQSIVLKGGIEQGKDEVIDIFEKEDGPNILLSSEVGSEGIDLQFASILINYDLPWNPMRVEQRIGRIDRIGQKSSKIWIWNLFYDDTIDARIYQRLYERIKIFEESIGGLEPILGDAIRKLSIDLLREELTPEQEVARIEQTTIALENRRQQEESLEQEAVHLVKYGDYILNQVKAARELHRWVNGHDIELYVIEFFNYYYTGCEFRQVSNINTEYEISLTNDAKIALESFIKSKGLKQKTVLTQNDPRPVKCRFENKVIVDSKGNVEIINQVHPIVRFVNENIDRGKEFYHPTVAIQLLRQGALDSFHPGLYVFTVQKWTAQGLQDIEQLFYAAAPVDGTNDILSKEQAEVLVTTALNFGVDWPESRTLVNIEEVVKVTNQQCISSSESAFRLFKNNLINQNEDRAMVQLRTLDLHLHSQKQKLQKVIEGHRLAGRHSLVKATEQRIRILENSIERKKTDISNKRGVKISNQDICIGVVNIQ